MRSVLNITITQMVYEEAKNGSSSGDLTCPADGGDKFKPERDGFHWSEELQGHILGAFFYGYVSYSQIKSNFFLFINNLNLM
jgi:hypothetical protein